MNIDAFTQILEIHGANSANWPEDSREACLMFADSNANAGQLLRQFQHLEQNLNDLEPPLFPGLEWSFTVEVTSTTRGVKSIERKFQYIVIV